MVPGPACLRGTGARPAGRQDVGKSLLDPAARTLVRATSVLRVNPDAKLLACLFTDIVLFVREERDFKSGRNYRYYLRVSVRAHAPIARRRRRRLGGQRGLRPESLEGTRDASAHAQPIPLSLLDWRSMEEKRSAFKKMTEVRPTSAALSTERHTQVIFTDYGASITLDIRYQSPSDCGVRALRTAARRSGGAASGAALMRSPRASGDAREYRRRRFGCKSSTKSGRSCPIRSLRSGRSCLETC